MHTKYFYTAKYETTFCAHQIFLYRLKRYEVFEHNKYFFTDKYETNILCTSKISLQINMKQIFCAH